MPSDHIRELQLAAARAAAHYSPNSQAKRVIVLDEHGERVISVCVPPLKGEVGGEKEAAVPGWSFTEKVAYFDGRQVPVAPSRVPLLRALAESREPLTAKELTKRAFDDQTDVANTRFHVGELRKELAADPRFAEFAGEVIVSEKDGYRLAVR